MELNVLERIVLVNTLPREGNFKNLKLLRIIKEEISFSEEENKALNFRQEGDQLKWDNAIADGKPIDIIPLKEINFGETVTELIVESLKSLNDQGKLTENHFSIYEKFIT